MVKIMGQDNLQAALAELLDLHGVGVLMFEVLQARNWVQGGVLVDCVHAHAPNLKPQTLNPLNLISPISLKAPTS